MNSETIAEISVLLVDDHAMIRAGLRALLKNEPDINIVGDARNGREAIEMVKELQPDVVVMDVRMPDLNGIDAARLARAACPDVRVIGLSANVDAQTAGQMIRAGAMGYVVKDAAYDELLAAIRAVMNGTVYFSPSIAPEFVKHFETSGGPPSVFGRLSGREREILQLISEGKATKEVAASLHLSVKTAETHRRNIMQKLNIDNVAELTKYAIREGLTSI